MEDIINKYDLFVFDLDDTLVKTEKYHYMAWLFILKQEFGDAFTMTYNEYISRFHSNKHDHVKTYLLNNLGLTDSENIIYRKNTYYIDLLKQNETSLQVVNGAQDFLKMIVNYNKKFVIVSNSSKTNVDYFTALFPILQMSSKNYYREMMIHKKPHPECYLNVINDYPNIRVVGFEDSITGIHAMSQVPDIDVSFINTENYYYYNDIIKIYSPKYVFNDYTTLQMIDQTEI